ncbi:Short-chain dehydrogenase [Nitrosospira sp. Nl5]|uniref:SDR family oxidoreductase n=1 Tax=Nitrosospira sp. Nl5 TaxID=200120 RepID=UPI00087FE0F6|nr:SDR family oxidoreductase [Nitrosospira sp. Nl5]SCY09898.1 Short-chain dehydrogenase [Nitrosospira sp. Nl5]
MARSIANSVIVITGASTGIGRAAALQFAREKATVVVNGRREQVLRKLAEECERLGGRALAIPADVTDQEALKSVARQAIETFGRIDVWVNNAAVTLFARVEEAPYEAYRRVIETNLLGNIHGARAVLPYFREQGSGTLINVSSVVGKIASPYVSAYTTSKFGIVGFSKSLRMELQDAPGIHVCTVLPASIDTPLFQHAANYMGRAIKPLEPVYSAEQVANAIVHLARHPRREMMVGNAGRMEAFMHTVAPGLMEWMFARQVSKDHFQDRPAPESEGNLFKPMEEYETVSGGWRTRQSNGKFSGRTIIGTVALGIAVGWLIARSSSKQPGAPGRAGLHPLPGQPTRLSSR